MIEEQEAVMPAADVCRKHSLRQGMFYRFKSQFADFVAQMG